MYVSIIILYFALQSKITTMKKKIKLEMTEAQFKAMSSMVDTISSMLGEGSDFTEVNSKNVRLFDRMLKNNGYKRQFN